MGAGNRDRGVREITTNDRPLRSPLLPAPRQGAKTTATRFPWLKPWAVFPGPFRALLDGVRNPLQNHLFSGVQTAFKAGFSSCTSDGAPVLRTSVFRQSRLLRSIFRAPRVFRQSRLLRSIFRRSRLSLAVCPVPERDMEQSPGSARNRAQPWVSTPESRTLNGCRKP